MAQQLVWLSGLLPYAQCVEVFERIGQCSISVSSLWRQVQAYGGQLLETAQHQQAHVSPERVQLGAAATDHAQVKGVSVDGGMVNIRGEGWKEVKVGAV